MQLLPKHLWQTSCQALESRELAFQSASDAFFLFAGDATCFDVDSTLRVGFVILAIVTWQKGSAAWWTL